MPQEILRQGSFTAGELDPQLTARRDVKRYYQAASSLENFMPTAQGPIRRRPGTVLVDRVRAPLVRVNLAPGPGGATAPNGGDTSSAIGDEPSALVTTAGMHATEPFVVLEIDFGAPVTVNVVDLVGYAAVADGTPGDAGPGPSKPDYPWKPPNQGPQLGDLP